MMRFRLQLFICFIVFGVIVGTSSVGDQEFVDPVLKFRVKMFYRGHHEAMIQVRSHIAEAFTELEDVEIVGDNLLLGRKIVDKNSDYQLDISALYVDPKIDEVRGKLIVVSFVFLDFTRQRSWIEAIDFLVNDTKENDTLRDIQKGLSKLSGSMFYHSALVSKPDRLEQTCNTIIDFFNTQVLEPFRKEPWRGVALGMEVKELPKKEPFPRETLNVLIAEELKKWLERNNYQIKKVENGYHITRKDSRNGNRYENGIELLDSSAIFLDEVIFIANENGTLSIGIEGVGTATFEVDQYGNLRSVANE